MHKLFIIASLPIITLLILSTTYLNNEYDNLTNNKKELEYLDIIQSSSDLTKTIQNELTLSVSYIKSHGDDIAKKRILKQYRKTNSDLKKFKNILQNSSKTSNFSEATTEYINTINSLLNNIDRQRERVIEKRTSWREMFNYYIDINTKLIILLNSLKFHSPSQKSNVDINAMSTLINYQEYAAKERALVSKIAVTSTIENDDLRQFNHLSDLQHDIDTNLKFLLQDNEIREKLNTIEKKYTSNYFNYTRDEIINFELKSIILKELFKTIGFGGMFHDLLQFNNTKNKKHYKNFLDKRAIFNQLLDTYISLSLNLSQEISAAQGLKLTFNTIDTLNGEVPNKTEVLKYYQQLDDGQTYFDYNKWYSISSQRINELQEIEKFLFNKIKREIQLDIEEIETTLIYQVVFILITIILLFVGTFLIANNMKRSIKRLESGINDFFDFLNFKRNKPENIKINSHDEIDEMAKSINKQMTLIQSSLENDLDFINETTHIVTMMKDGDFSERPYFEPNNPHLKELKNVFDELIKLITQKIKEQTDSLEALNASLEDRVHFQTIELEKQIKEITIARDKAIQAEVAKDEFLANMSHEIRTPLNAILGFVTILKKQIQEEKALNYLDIIDTSGKSLLTIINDILDFSKIQSGKFIISPHDVDIIEEISNTALLFASKAYEKHLIFDFYIDTTIPQTVEVDEVRVKQILSNLLSNAIKFTNYGRSIRVGVTIKNSNLIISVQDTGIGISQDHLDKIFSAFEQADGSTTRKYGGTGLGLSISYKLAVLMDGELSVKSTEGLGSTFTLSVPVKIRNNNPKKMIDPEKLSKCKIALLDTFENSQKLKLIKKYLNNLGATDIITLHKFQKDGYDLLYFFPDDEYNEEIIENSNTPAIAILRNSDVTIADIKHISPLYTPFTPKLIIQSIYESGVMESIKNNNELPIESTDEETQFIGSILVAEDNKTNQMLISLLLEDYGLEYKIAQNGVEAVAMFKEEKFDLVLMDENMPELNGIGAMQQIKEYEKEKKVTFTPIIALTASVLESDKKMFLEAGMDGFVGKPINNQELESELGRFLEKKD